MARAEQEERFWKLWVDLAEKPVDPIEDLGPQILDTLEEQLLMDDEWVDRGDRRLAWWGAPLPLEFNVSQPRLAMGVPTVKVTADVLILAEIGTSTFERACLLMSTINGLNSGGMMWVDPNEEAFTPRSLTTHTRAMLV